MCMGIVLQYFLMMRLPLRHCNTINTNTFPKTIKKYFITFLKLPRSIKARISEEHNIKIAVGYVYINMNMAFMAIFITFGFYDISYIIQIKSRHSSCFWTVSLEFDWNLYTHVSFSFL